MSNLSFLSKILQKVVLHQILNRLLTNILFYSHHSDYRAGRSTDTALLKIVDDLLSAPDEDKGSLLCLLDLSAAFDPIDHSILLSRLSYSFGISDTVLAWFTSYLADRTRTVSRLYSITAFPKDLSYDPSSLFSTLNPFLR